MFQKLCGLVACAMVSNIPLFSISQKHPMYAIELFG